MRRSFSIFLLLLMALCLPSLPGQAQNSATPPKAASAEKSETTWKTMVEGIEHDISLRDASVQRIEQAFPEMRDDLYYGLAKASNRLDQLTLLHGVSGSTPWAYRTILIQLDSLKRYVQLKMAPLWKAHNKINQIKDDYHAIRNIRLRQKSSNLDVLVSPSMANATAGYRDLKHSVKDIKNDINDALSKGDTLLAAIADDRNATLQIYFDEFRRYYFAPAPSLFTRSGLHDMADEAMQWADNMPRFWYPLLVWVHWENFLLYFAFCSLALWAAGAIVLQRLRERLQTASGHHIAKRGGWVLISLGLGLATSLYLTYFTGNQATHLAWVDMVALGMIILTNSIVKGVSGMEFSRPSQNPLTLLFALMVLGDLMHIFIVPAACLTLIWLPAIALAFLRMRSIARTNKIPLDRGLARVSTPVLAIFGGLALFSYPAASLILTQIWFMALLTFMLCAMLKKFFSVRTQLALNAQKAQKETAEASEAPISTFSCGPIGPTRPLGTPALLEMAYPFTVTIIVYLFLGWSLIFAGGRGFASWVLRQNIDVSGVHISPRSIIVILALFFFTRMVIGWMVSFFEELPRRGGKFNPALAHTFATTVSYLFWVLYILVSLNLLGVSLSALTWIASGLSVGIGFGMKDIVNNFVSGLIILFGGSIKKGDVLQHNKMIGEVTDVSVRNTTIRTLDNTMVIIPNSSFLKGDISNYSYGDTTIRVTVPVTVIPGSKRNKVTKLMLKAAKKHPLVIDNPEPQVLFKGFGQLGLDYHLYVWVRNFQDMYPVQSDLTDTLDTQFQENKVQVAFRTVKTKYKVKKKEEDLGVVLRAKRKELYKLVNERKRNLNSNLRRQNPDKQTPDA
ncbi:MAG: mechanosensitive ion channel family protein [Desulfovibrio sp.]|uniref:mechanosensitive ion channel family protein n=1 Tax=Desulfovibrio sp. 7SRBS1 TaxID=3378064 RepID=UPI003B3FCB29